jgi:dTDP-4-dehydrorhamnose 3,5-epimerase|tara:strand:+ start:3881 stop:4420 length:540 start_codon:yes stop_codon:yes gene_type:complete
MKLIGTSSIFSDVKYYEGKIFNDERGRFQKPFFGDLVEEKFNNYYEVIVSTSKKNVIRGLHFQNPPNDVDKIVFCLDGVIKDVFVDLRKSSETFGEFDSIKLDKDNSVSVLIPKGFAHGFSVLSDEATVLYLQSKPFNEESDSGIHYESLDIDWESTNPVLSEKDINLPSLIDFNSPWT